jgi:glycosyltransferase involved in cell wall biosynthesis
MTTSINTDEKADLISVIMPSFNAEKYLQQAVDSVIHQTYPCVELIVVDDGSTDTSRDILERYGNRIRLKGQQNKGPYPARNLGLRESKGKFVAFLDADDYWHPEFLEKLHDALIRSDAEFAYCGWQNVGDSAPSSRPHIPPKYEDGEPVRTFLKECPWPIHAILMRRQTVVRMGGFSERCFSAMDYDLWLRLAASGSRMIRVPEVLSFYRWHNCGQISAMRWRQVEDAWKVRSEFIRVHPALVADFDKGSIREITGDFLLKSGYKSYWDRNLESSQKIFRMALIEGHWSAADLKYLLTSLLPATIYKSLIRAVDRFRASYNNEYS